MRVVVLPRQRRMPLPNGVRAKSPSYSSSGATMDLATQSRLLLRASARILYSMVYASIDLERLTVGERLGLIEQVWESLRHRMGTVPLSESERALIEARRAEHHADPSSALAWETVRADLLQDQDADEQATSPGQ